MKHHYPHSFRTYFANALRKAGVQERFIDYMLGYKPKMGGAYFPLDDLEANYRKAISELSTREVKREALERERKALKEKMIEIVVNMSKCPECNRGLYESGHPEWWTCGYCGRYWNKEYLKSVDQKTKNISK